MDVAGDDDLPLSGQNVVAEMDGAGSLVWDTNGLPAGEYLVYTVIEDELNQYAPGRVVIEPAGGAAVGGVVFDDSDLSGSRGPGEAGVGGVTVELHEDVNGSGVIDAGDLRRGARTTNSAGHGLWLTSPAAGSLAPPSTG